MLDYIKTHPELSADETNIKISYKYDSRSDRPEIFLNGHPMRSADMDALSNILQELDPSLFDNIPPSPTAVELPQPKELFLDIFDDGDFLTVVVELPSVSKDQIELYNLTPTELELRAGDIRQTILLPTSVNETSVKARYHNGILEIILEKQPELTQSRRIKVE
ncbi:MAG: Hsp20/alpha crystallin family protein [Promethearchaeota archaeon]